MSELPELPAEIEPPEQWRKDTRRAVREAYRHYREVTGLTVDDTRCFTASQMREYALLAVKAERERCAKLCDAHARTEVNGYVAYNCADDIRAT